MVYNGVMGNKIKIAELYASGLSQSEIARRLKLTRQRVHQIVRNYHTSDFKEIVFEKDGGLCVICRGGENLHVHHLDGNTKNNTLKNLATLCRGCHEDVHHQGLDIAGKVNLCKHCGVSFL
jgi:5-methylcytosine-specific restriction endonuclease McrA